MIKKISFLIFLFYGFSIFSSPNLYWWQPDEGFYGVTNFGDELSKVLVERILKRSIRKAPIDGTRKFLAIGSILQMAQDLDIVWGTGINGKHMDLEDYSFEVLDVRAVRGPLTRDFLRNFGIEAPEIYGDPALLLPDYFPEFKKNPIKEYVIVPNIGEMHYFLGLSNVVMPTLPWNEVVQKIIESKFVIATSLRGIVVAEAFGIPARLLRVSDMEPLFKYSDYYFGTGRKNYLFATSIEEALEMGGESLPIFDKKALIKAFPHDQL